MLSAITPNVAMLNVVVPFIKVGIHEQKNHSGALTVWNKPKNLGLIS
jgi:hypothetical protein